eukprot:4073004-Ditylum_brightwellii.AAC.1
MLWDVRHLWAMGARFAFNTYRYWRKLVQKGQDDLVMSKEGVMQGDPLSMILYVLVVLPIIKVLNKLLEVLPYLVKQLQEWFADDLGLAGFFEAIAIWFNKLCEIRPPRGYIPEPTKSILITHEKNMEKAIEFFAEIKFKVKEGHCYLDGFIGLEASTSEYVSEKVQDWMASVNIFAHMMPHQPKATFAGFACLLQFEWAHIHQAMELSGDAFDLLEEAINKKLLPALFAAPQIPADLCTLT